MFLNSISNSMNSWLNHEISINNCQNETFWSTTIYKEFILADCLTVPVIPGWLPDSACYPGLTAWQCLLSLADCLLSLAACLLACFMAWRPEEVSSKLGQMDISTPNIYCIVGHDFLRGVYKISLSLSHVLSLSSYFSLFLLLIPTFLILIPSFSAFDSLFLVFDSLFFAFT